MIRSLYTAASGMQANQTYVDNISNNLSNVNTVGFKAGQVEFEDLMYQTIKDPGADNGDGTKTPVGIQVGLGSNVVSINKVFTQGSIQQTGNALDLAIQGDGFFQVRMANGQIGYTRAGNFQLSADGYICDANGQILEPGIVIPQGASGLSVDPQGNVSATLQTGSAAEIIGKTELARFINPAGLLALGGNLYTQTPASGDPIIGDAGSDSFGALQSQSLESSNVQMVNEMVSMIVAQRAYEISSKAITTSDDMLQTATGLKR